VATWKAIASSSCEQQQLRPVVFQLVPLAIGDASSRTTLHCCTCWTTG
jgi:hypothetical protein